MKKLKLFTCLAIGAAFFFSSCEKEEVEAPGTNYVAFQGQAIDLEVEISGSSTQNVSLYSANVAGNDRTYNVEVLSASTIDQTYITVPSTVTIPAGSNKGDLAVSINDYAGLDGEPVTLVLNVTEPNGDGSSIGEPATINVFRECLENRLFYYTVFDDYPEEVYWRIIDLNAGVIVASNNSSPAFGGYAGRTGFTNLPICLSDGDYRLEVYDAYGDGAGEIYLLDGNKSTLYYSDGDYGAGFDFDFSL